VGDDQPVDPGKDGCMMIMPSHDLRENIECFSTRNISMLSVEYQMVKKVS